MGNAWRLALVWEGLALVATHREQICASLVVI
jgi:hypothetical protein